MKKTFRTVALMMVLSTLAVSCQKETLVEPEATCMQVSTMIMPSSYQHDEIQVIKEGELVLYEIKCE